MTMARSPVRDIVGGYLGAAEVFRRYGIDFYRIGSHPLWEAAARQGIDLDTLTNALSHLPENPVTLPQATRELITFISRRYRTTHHNQLFQALRLARVAASEPGYPSSLARLLMVLADTMEDHQVREEEDLYPAMLHSPKHHLRFPVLRAMMDHDEISDQLDTLNRLTSSYAAPAGAGKALKKLYALCATLDGDIRYYMHLENNVLFPRFVGDRAIAS